MQEITNFKVSKNKGIYCIINTINNKRYIGSAVNLHERLTQHFGELSRGIHFNKHLQNSFNKHGNENFYIEILEEFEEIKYESLLVLEDFYIKKYNTIDCNFGYNKRTNDSFPELSEESKSKRIQSNNQYKIKVKCFYKETGLFYRDFESISECAKHLNDQTTNICYALNNISRSVKGFVIIKAKDYDSTKCYKYVKYKPVYSEEMIKHKQINNKKNKTVFVWTDLGCKEYFSIAELTRNLGLKKDSLSHLLKKHNGIKYLNYYITCNNEDYTYYDKAWEYIPGVNRNQYSK